VTACTLVSAAHAEDAQTAHPWIVPDVLAAAKSEGALTVYGSMNEG